MIMIISNLSSRTDEILAELQFSFVCFLVGQHYDSFEQWKRLLRLFCQCHDAVAKHTELYLALISDMHFQVSLSVCVCACVFV